MYFGNCSSQPTVGPFGLPIPPVNWWSYNGRSLIPRRYHNSLVLRPIYLIWPHRHSTAMIKKTACSHECKGEDGENSTSVAMPMLIHTARTAALIPSQSKRGNSPSFLILWFQMNTFAPLPQIGKINPHPYFTVMRNLNLQLSLIEFVMILTIVLSFHMKVKVENLESQKSSKMYSEEEKKIAQKIGIWVSTP